MLILSKIYPSIFLLRNRILAFRSFRLDIGKSVKVINRKPRKDFGMLNRSWTTKRQLNNKNAGGLCISNNSKLMCGKGFIVREGLILLVNQKDTLEIGDNVSVNTGTRIEYFDSVVIGNDTIITDDCLIRDGNNHAIIDNNYLKTQKIVIGESAWIEIRAIMLPGATIGGGSIEAAGAVATKDILEKTTVGGLPARVIKENVE